MDSQSPSRGSLARQLGAGEEPQCQVTTETRQSTFRI